MDAHTATQGYNQLESFINFPNKIFQIEKIETHYTANSSTFVQNTNDMLYADACLWDPVVGSDTYLDCIGSDGKSGGTVTTRYTVKIISGVGTTTSLNTLLYDFSGSSFHYNADFEAGVRFVSITSPLSLDKSFSPKSITTAGGTSTLTLAITNSSTSQVDNVSISDPLPSGMKVASTPGATQSAGCVSGTFSPSADDTSLSYSGSVAASGTCTLTVAITASPDGSYTNTAELLLDSGVTGITATDLLGVNTTSACTATTLVSWVVGTADNPPIANIQGSNIDSPNTVAAAGAGLTTTIETVVGNPINSWKGGGFEGGATLVQANNDYFSFRIKAESGFVLKDLIFSLDLESEFQGTVKGPRKVEIYNSTDSYAGKMGALIEPSSASFINYSRPLTGEHNDVTFRVYGYDPGITGATNFLYLDNIKIEGCVTSNLDKAQLSKAFSPTSINAGATSTLTFTLTNPNASDDLTGASFTDILPSGMKVAATPNASTTCSGATWNPAADDPTLSFSGGTISQSDSCTAQVDVTVNAAGSYTNTSGYISTTEAGINTNPHDHATSPGQGQASLTVTIGPPQIAKSFSPNPIAVGETSTITFTLTNPNSDADLTGVAFSDDYTSPTSSDIVNATAPNTSTTCEHDSGLPTLATVTAAGDGTTLSLANATIPAGGTCIVQVDVTASTDGIKINTTGAVTATNGTGLTGNTATDTLVVNALTPKLTLRKDISTSAAGPWASYVNVAAGTNVYYRFTIENTGDTALSPIWVTDPELSEASACSWPASLPKEESASCVVGPITAGSSSDTNTATAHGTYSTTTVTNTDTADYNITSLQLTKTVSPTTFTDTTTSLTYSYTITNNGTAVVLGPTVALSDTNATAACDAIATAQTSSGLGNGDGNLDPGEWITCSATYNLKSSDRSIGYVTNVATATIGTTKTNTDTATSISDKPDLVVTKTNNIVGGQAIEGTPFVWTITVKNNGGGNAIFADTKKIFSDTLPSGATYTFGASNIDDLDSNSGTLSCTASPTGGAEFSCAATGAVTIGSNESFTVTLNVTPSTFTTQLTNTVTVDPDSSVAESNEGNNNGSDIVNVSAPLPNIKITKTNNVSGPVVYTDDSFTWTLAVEYSGSGNTFTDGQNIVSDALPGASSYYPQGVLTVTPGSTVPTGTIACSISGTALSCTASGDVTLSDGASFSTDFSVTPTSAGTLENTAVVNPDFLFSESNTGDNSSIDSVTVTDVPDLDLSKSNGATTTTVTAGGTTTYELTVTNSGNTATSGTITVVDVLPSGLSITDADPITLSGADKDDWSCAAASNVITCTSNASVTIPATTDNTSVFAFTVDVDTDASGTLVNEAQVGGGSDPTNPDAPTSGTAGTCADASPPEGCATDSDTVKNPPVNTVPATATTVKEQTQTAISGVSVTDTNGNLTSTKLTVTGGVLNVTASGTATLSGNGTSSVTISGSETDINATLTSLTYTSDNGTTSDTVTMLSTDGTSLTDSDTFDINVQDPPVNTVPGTQVVSTGVQTAISGVSVTDTNGNLTSTQLTVPSGSFNVDLTGGASISAGGNDTGTLTLSGTETQINAALATLKFTGTADTTVTMLSTDALGLTDSDPFDITIASIFDPPSAIKSFSEAGLPELEFRMVWINSGNTAAIDVQVTDNIPTGTTYVTGSISCSPQGASSTVDVGTTPTPVSPLIAAVPTWSCGFDVINNRVQWQGAIGPDDGNLTEASADNEVVITFRVTVDDAVNEVHNQGFSRTDVDNDGDFDEETVLGVSAVSSNLVVWNRTASSGGDLDAESLPKTGFAPGKVTPIADTMAPDYNPAETMELEIPMLGVRIPIVGVPENAQGWDVDWLWDQAGWLEGTAFPTWNGNSVLTSHVYLSNGLPGPFVDLKTLKWGDEIIVHAHGYRYIYKVQRVRYFLPNDTSALSHEDNSWLTLVTCVGYNETLDNYKYRVAVRAVRVSAQVE